MQFGQPQSSSGGVGGSGTESQTSTAQQPQPVGAGSQVASHCPAHRSGQISRFAIIKSTIIARSILPIVLHLKSKGNVTNLYVSMGNRYPECQQELACYDPYAQVFRRSLTGSYSSQNSQWSSESVSRAKRQYTAPFVPQKLTRTHNGLGNSRKLPSSTST